MADMLIEVEWNEDGSATILGRLTGGTNATGAATGVAGEGKWIKQADLISGGLTYAVFDESSTTPSTAITSGSLTISSVILDTPSTSSTYWTRDTVGYNFIWDAPATLFPTGGHRYVLEIRAESSGSIVGWGRYAGIAQPVHTS